jgi:hypothetical protein
MVMGNMKKYYSGSISSEKIAAQMYDRFAIQTLGLRAKTNFDYRRKDLLKIIADLEEAVEEAKKGEASPNTLILKSSL